MKIIRPSKGTYLIFYFIWLLICIPGVYAIKLGQWEGFLFILFGGMVTVGAISRYRISWDTNQLIYQRLLTSVNINIKDISHVDIHGPVTLSRFEPKHGLRFFSTHSKKPFLTINITPFSRNDIKELTEDLKSYSVR